MRPSINDFSLSKIQTMEAHDGYAIRCNILYKNKVIGEYYDAGYGAMGTFDGDKSKLEVLKDFPSYKVDCGEGIFVDVKWDIDILVTRLLELEEIKSKMSKDRYVVMVCNKKTRLKSFASVPRKLDKEIALRGLREKVADGEFTVYMDEGDLEVRV